MNALVVLCDADGVVRRWRSLGGGVGAFALSDGVLFPTLFGPGDVARALDALAALGREGVLVDRPFELPRDGGGRESTVYLSGAAMPVGRLVLVAARQPGAATAIRQDLASVDAELAEGLRPLDRWLAPAAARDAALFEEMTRVNSELANAQRDLAKANAELKLLNEQRNRLMGMLAHDLRTPLQVITGFAEHLGTRLNGRIEPRDMGSLDRIRESSLFMSHLIDDALSMAAAQAGKLHVARRSVDLGGLVRRNAGINGIIARGKDIRLEVRVADGLPRIQADPSKLEQLMNNLLSNAVKYSERGTRVDVTVDRTDSHARVIVADEGRGMSKAETARIFQPFARHAQSGTAGEMSVGLGLFICRTIVDAHGGRILVRSAPGQGSTFTVELPLAGAG
ncbi:HAMP domain-containing histidine kinase [Azospirillum sp. RWY-5-1]|uniref:histidine kinase n=1 Tax=Azospirillum oleiclasticum TaxID=2735135 RepID=A0ABX2TBC3_9PROT|nr:HAMP domain-containing sensor histidine kinase [Azospirillum oleiclasticum]NYZ15237.1 HAMP domain-containing histidine kinase [Azospirillum oleiclasticum]NYZ21342.1 HAMP domain-containing histidine kinase [Azospirillum oleiclasticum]